MRRILSIDGGGVRGIIPAVLLSALERSTGRPARETFDFVAGTSSGALLAAGIAAGIPAEQMVRLYLDRAPEIFHRVPLISPLKRLFLGHLYDIAALRRVIREELGVEAADWRVNDAPIDLLITAKRLSDGVPWYFVRDNTRNSCRAGGYRLSEVVTASAAAPTFFRPWHVRGIGELIDGGTGVAGNPAYQACVEAFHYTDAYDPASSVLVSVGTGRFFGRQRPRWLGAWLGWLLSELLRSPAEQQTELVERHFPQVASYRLDTALEHDVPLDAVDRLEELQEIGERLAASVDWQAILDGSDDRWRVSTATSHARAYCRIGPS